MGKLMVVGLALLALVASCVTMSVLTPSDDPIVIDGKGTTIALASIGSIDPAVIIQKLISLVKAIIAALKAPRFSYWENVKDDVKLVVGSYINNHSISQVEHYQDDLQTLLLRYVNAPAYSTDYADKDHQAAALNINIMSHRFLVMSGDLKYSLILHFEDIAAMHISVLKDVAQVYSGNGSYSRWYYDLNEQLKGYITYLNDTTNELDKFRVGAMDCDVKNGTCVTRQAPSKQTVTECYDRYTIYDYVNGYKDHCDQLKGRTDCVDFCSNYKVHVQKDVDQFAAAKINPVRESWVKLYNFTQSIISNTSQYYNVERETLHKFVF